MTIAEAFIARGKAEVAANMLKEGIDKRIIVKTTQLELSQIELLQKEQLEKETDSHTKR